MDESGWLPAEAEEPRTAVFRRQIDGGREHFVGVDVGTELTTVKLTIADAHGLSVGRVAGEIPTETLSVAGELLGFAMAAAARANGGTSASKLDGKRRQYPNQGARWTPDEEALLTARFADGAEIADLRREFGRSANSIRARLVQLGHLTADEWPAGLGARRAA
jgi:hypothetical protein